MEEVCTRVDERCVERRVGTRTDAGFPHPRFV